MSVLSKLEYQISEFSSLPAKINRFFDKEKNGKVIVCVADHPTSTEAEEKYSELLDAYELGLAFYPYSEAVPFVNIVIGRKNPISEIRLLSGQYIDVARFINLGWIMFDLDRLGDLRFNENLKAMFFDDFFNRCVATGNLPSNGMFIDVHQSWNYFQKYRKSPINIIKEDLEKESKELNIKLDCSTRSVLKRVHDCELKNQEKNKNDR